MLLRCFLPWNLHFQLDNRTSDRSRPRHAAHFRTWCNISRSFSSLIRRFGPSLLPALHYSSPEEAKQFAGCIVFPGRKSAGKTLAQGNSFAPSMSNEKAERPKRPRSPQKRTRLMSCPFLWKGRLKSISSRFREKPPAGRHTNCEPSGAGRSWKGGARERADGVFCAPGMKRRRSKADFAPTWSGVRESNPPIRLGKHIGQIFYAIRITKK